MALMKSLLDLLAPSSQAKRTHVERRAEPAFVPSDAVAAPALVVLFADLGGPNGPALSSHLADALARLPEISVYRRTQALKLPSSGTLAERLAQASQQGRAWIKEDAADILLWGEVDAGSQTATIRFLPAAVEADGRPGIFGLGDTLVIPARFSNEFDDVLAAAVLGAAGPGKPNSRARVTPLLADAIAKAERVLSQPLATLTPGQQASLQICLGHAFAAQSRLASEDRWLERAIQAYKAALDKVSAADDPMTWGMVQNHLAAAYLAQAERTKDSIAYEAAAGAYRAAATTLGRAEHPNDWALAHVRLASVLYRQATREGRTKLLKEASAALEQALTVYTLASSPARWSETMNQYAAILTDLGEQVTGTAYLEQAIAIFRKVIEVRRRDVVPLLWAQTANNLGAAAFALAKRTNRDDLLREAASCFEGAIEVYQRHGRRQMVLVTDKNLQRVQSLLATRAAAAKAPSKA